MIALSARLLARRASSIAVLATALLDLSNPRGRPRAKFRSTLKTNAAGNRPVPPGPPSRAARPRNPEKLAGVRLRTASSIATRLGALSGCARGRTDEELPEEVHQAMARQYDLVVIGTGTAAKVAASRCRAAGWRVAAIDHLPFGGTCALRGCDPKKVLVGVAETLDQDRRMRRKGIAGGEPAIDWRALMAFKRSFTEPVPSKRKEDFAKNGIDAFEGRARFRGPRTIEVNGDLLEARFILIAAGAVPMRLR